MKKLKIILIGITALLSCSSASTESETKSWYVTLKGKVGFPQQGKITIQELSSTSSTVWQDTILLAGNYTFTKKIKLKEPGYYRINFYNKQIVNLILYKTDVEINVDGNNAQGFQEIKGSPDMNILENTQKIVRATDSMLEVQKLNEEFAKAQQTGDEKKMMDLQQEYLRLAKINTDKAAAYLKEQPASLAVINLLENNVLDIDQYMDVYIAVTNKLKGEWQTYTHAKAFIERVEKIKKISVGQIAPEIALPNPDGKIIKLTSLRGKYVLIDFWAKWCGPCRKENPNVVRAYNKYKDKGFTVFGVSLDRSKEDWLQAIQQDGLTWIHVSDLKYWQSEAAKTYNITGIPFSVLIDPKGAIIAKNLRGAALDQKLKDIFSE